MRKLTVTHGGVILPSAGDAVSYSAYATALLSFVVGLLAIFHPSLFGAKGDAAIEATIPLVSIAIGSFVSIANIWRTTSATNKAMTATVVILTKDEYLLEYGSGSIAKAAGARMAKKHNEAA